MIYVTSDTHFGHEKVIEYNNRPWKTVKEMNEGLIERWNSVVRPNDEVYHLGDFAFWFKMPMEELQSIFDRLNGKKHLIIGNHDTKEIKELGWESVQHYKKIKHNKQKFVLFHYPIEEWEGMYQGTIHLYGHSHNNNYDKVNRIHIGLDTHDWTPVLLDDVALLDGEITKNDGRGFISTQNWKKGILHGKSKVKLKEDLIEFSNYENGKLHGNYYIKGDYDSTTVVKNYNHGKLHGVYKTFDCGRKKMVSEYKDNLLHGEYKEFDDDGNVNKVIIYEEGKEISSDLENNKTSLIKIKSPLKDGRTEVREYHLHGGIKSIYELNGCDQKDGQFRKWFSSGELMQEIKYIKNKKEGRATIYRVSRYNKRWFKSNELNYVNNQKQGKQKNFSCTSGWNYDNSPSEYLDTEYNAVKNNYHGKYISYSEDGEIIAVGKYANNKRRGLITYPLQEDITRKYSYYDKDGKKISDVFPMEEMKTINRTIYDAWFNKSKDVLNELLSISQILLIEKNYFIDTKGSE